VERFVNIAGYVILAVMAVAAVLLLLHYAGVIAAVSPAGLWGFLWGPPAIVAGAAALLFVAMWVGDRLGF
jgi:hypothetical protein